MKLKMNIGLVIVWCGAVCAAGAAVAATPGGGNAVQAFVQHPTHCAQMLGGDAQTGESAGGAYARDLSAAMASLKGKDAESVKFIAEQCRAKAGAKKD